MFVDLQQAFENSLRKWIILIVHYGSYRTLYKATNTLWRELGAWKKQQKLR